MGCDSVKDSIKIPLQIIQGGGEEKFRYGRVKYAAAHAEFPLLHDSLTKSAPLFDYYYKFLSTWKSFSDKESGHVFGFEERHEG